MKLNDINNVTKQERLEPRKYYSEEQLVELFGIGKKDDGVKQSDVYKVLLNIEKRKSGTHPVRFKDGEVVDVDPELAKRVNNWILQREPSDRKNSERMVSSWEGFQKIAKLLGIEKMLPVAKITDDADIVRMRELAGLTTEGYYKLPDYDKDKYQKRDGLEGPIPTKSGKVVYYDPQEGMYYDPDTDMFITYDEFRKYDGYETEEVQVNEDEEYNQVKAILDKHNVTSIDDLEYGSDAYEELFGYYMDSGEMPYGIMKARTGMPDEWISDRLYDLGLLESDAMGMNKYGISAVHKDGKFYAFRHGKMVGGPFDTIEQLADFQKKSIENESVSEAPEVAMTQPELPMPINYNFTKADFLDNESENMHTENALELAKMFGTKEEIKRMEYIMLAHNTRGYIIPSEMEERDALVKKYYPKLEGIDPTTGKEQPKTVMGVNVRSKEDKIKDKKDQIALAKRNAPKSGLTTKDVPKLEKELADLMKEEEHDNKGFTDKQIKQAFGVLNDPRYHQGNYSGAVATIEKIAKGLSKHPSVANALKRANEDINEFKIDKVQSTYDAIMKGIRNRGPAEESEVGDYIPSGMTGEEIRKLIDMLEPQGYDKEFLLKDLAPMMEYEGQVEPRAHTITLSGDYDPENGVSEKDAEDIEKLLARAGINADVEPSEEAFDKVIVHTMSDKQAVLKVLGNLGEDDEPATVSSGNSVLDRLRLIVKDKSNAKVQLDDGELRVDLYTASAITQVYDKVNDANKAKMEKMMNTKEGLVKLTNAVFGILNKGKMSESMSDNIGKDIEKGLSTDAIIGKYANKRTDNTDDIRKIIQRKKWDMRMKERPVTINHWTESVIDENVLNAYRELIEKRLNEAYDPDAEAKMNKKDARQKALQDIQMNPNTAKDPELRKELIKRKAQLDKTGE